MEITSEKFPLHQALSESDLDLHEKAYLSEAFNNAVQGCYQDKYRFGLIMSQLATDINASDLPKCTNKVKEATLRSCLALFEDLAAQGNMREDYNRGAQTMALRVEATLKQDKNFTP